MKTDQILEKLTVVPLYIAAVLLPSFFLPITSEWLEWNKYYLLAILVVISLLAWLGRGLVAKKLVIVRSPLDFPLLALWVVMLVSSIFAKDRIVAFFGPADNVSWSFLALTFYLLTVFLVRGSVRDERGLVRFLELLGIGMGLPALYFWLGRIGLLGWFTGPRFNPAAELNVLFGVLQVLLFIVALGVLMQVKLERSRQILWSVLAILAFITVLALGFTKVWLIATIGLFVLLVLAVPRLGQVRYPIVSVAMVGFVLALVFWILGTPQFLTIRTNTEVTLAQGRSWQITNDTLREGVKSLLVGSGPGTFVYDFSAHRREVFNNNIFWNTRFSRPGTSSYQILSEMGVLGALAAVVLFLMGIGTILQMWSKKRIGGAVQLGLGTPLAAAWITSLVALFFVNYGTTLWFTFFILLTLLAAAGAQIGAVPEHEVALSMKTTPQYALATSFIYIVVIALVVVGGIFLGRFYGADVLAVKAVRAHSQNQFEPSEALFTRATTLDPYRARYALGLANTYLRHAGALSREPSADRERVGALVANAINVSRRATTTAPLSVASWEQLATMYGNARVFAQEANEWVINALTEAINLEATNPRLYAQRGIAYRLMDKPTEAKAEFERAVELKPDYAPAHYQLSILHEQANELDAAIQSAARAAQIASRDINAQFNLARLLYNRNGEGDWDAAERLYRRILTINKDHANTLYALGVLLERKGDAAGAALLYEHILELDPNAAIVRERLNNLPEGTPRRVSPEPVEEGEVTEGESAEE